MTSRQSTIRPSDLNAKPVIHQTQFARPRTTIGDIENASQPNRYKFHVASQLPLIRPLSPAFRSFFSFFLEFN